MRFERNPYGKLPTEMLPVNIYSNEVAIVMFLAQSFCCGHSTTPGRHDLLCSNVGVYNFYVIEFFVFSLYLFGLLFLILVSCRYLLEI